MAALAWKDAVALFPKVFVSIHCLHKFDIVQIFWESFCLFKVVNPDVRQINVQVFTIVFDF